MTNSGTLLDLGAGDQKTTTPVIRQMYPHMKHYGVDPSVFYAAGEGVTAAASAIDCTVEANFGNGEIDRYRMIDIARVAQRISGNTILHIDVGGDEYLILLRLLNTGLLSKFHAVHVVWTEPQVFWHDAVRDEVADYVTPVVGK